MRVNKKPLIIAAALAAAALFGLGGPAANAAPAASGASSGSWRPTGAQLPDLLGRPSLPGGCNIIQASVAPGICAGIFLYHLARDPSGAMNSLIGRPGGSAPGEPWDPASGGSSGGGGCLPHSDDPCYEVF